MSNSQLNNGEDKCELLKLDNRIQLMSKTLKVIKLLKPKLQKVVLVQICSFELCLTEFILAFIYICSDFYSAN